MALKLHTIVHICAYFIGDEHCLHFLRFYYKKQGTVVLIKKQSQQMTQTSTQIGRLLNCHLSVNSVTIRIVWCRL